MIYIDNNTTGFTIPRITNGIGDKVILINQITKRRFELSTNVLNDEGYKVDITDLKLEIGQYDYVVKKNNIPLESGILQVGGYKSQNNQYEVDFNIIQYEPNIVYTPLPEKVLDVTENGVYNVESFDKVDVDVKDKESVIIIEQLENQIDTLEDEISTLEDEISTLEGTVSGLETEVNRLDDLKDSLQSQIDSVTTLSVTENGIYTPEEGTLGWNNVEVNTKFVIPNGMKFGNSTFTSLSSDLDFSNVTDFESMFSYNTNIKYIYGINMDNANSMTGICHGCNNLEVFNGIRCNKTSDYSTVGCEQMFWNCGKLHTINFLDISKTRSAYRAFTNCYELQNITFEESINGSTDFSSCTKLTYDSVKSILTACSNKVSEGTRTLTFNRILTDQNGELAELVAICNTKEWTINGLTLQ